MKKVSRVIGLSLLCLACKAGAESKSLSRFSIGLQGGYVHTKINFKDNLGPKNATAKGGSGGLFLGYDYGLTSYITLGPEVFFQYQNAKIGDDDKSRLKESVGILLRLGYVKDKFNPYLKGGYVNNRLAYEGKKNKFSIRQSGILAGMGLDYNLSRHTSLGIEYNYSYFSKMIDGVKLKSHFNAINLRLKYSF